MYDGLELLSEVFDLTSIIVAYFLPSIIGCWRDHHNSKSIFISNLLFGWTVLGWAITLIWSFSSIQKGRVSNVERNIQTTTVVLNVADSKHA